MPIHNTGTHRSVKLIRHFKSNQKSDSCFFTPAHGNRYVVRYIKTSNSSSPDDFIIVRQLLPAGQLVERFAEHPPVGVLILHDHRHQLPHLFHQPLVGLFLFLIPRLVLVVVVVEFLLPLAASLFGGGGAGVVVLRLVVFVLVVLRSDGLRTRSYVS